MRQHPNTDDTDKFYLELVGGSDRACALVGGAMIDNGLAQLLLSKMRLMFQPEVNALFFDKGAVLMSLSAKIDIANSFALCTLKRTANFDSIRRIRNTFAHALIPISFENNLIQKECESLPEFSFELSDDIKDLNPHRRQYIGACAKLLSESAMKAQESTHYNEILLLLNGKSERKPQT